MAERKWSDNRSTLLCWASIIALVAGVGGWLLGADSVTDTARLSAANEATHEIVRLVEEPSQNIQVLAERSCRGENSTSFDNCMITFLNQFATIYVVNLLTGEYVRIGGEGRGGGTE